MSEHLRGIYPNLARARARPCLIAGLVVKLPLGLGVGLVFFVVIGPTIAVAQNVVLGGVENNRVTNAESFGGQGKPAGATDKSAPSLSVMEMILQHSPLDGHVLLELPLLLQEALLLELNALVVEHQLLLPR